MIGRCIHHRVANRQWQVCKPNDNIVCTPPTVTLYPTLNGQAQVQAQSKHSRQPIHQLHPKSSLSSIITPHLHAGGLAETIAPQSTTTSHLTFTITARYLHDRHVRIPHPSCFLQLWRPIPAFGISMSRCNDAIGAVNTKLSKVPHAAQPDLALALSYAATISGT